MTIRMRARYRGSCVVIGKLHNKVFSVWFVDAILSSLSFLEWLTAKLCWGSAKMPRPCRSGWVVCESLRFVLPDRGTINCSVFCCGVETQSHVNSMNEGFRCSSSCSRENHQLRGKRRNDDEGRKGKSVVVVVVVMVVVVIEFFSVLATYAVR